MNSNKWSAIIFLLLVLLGTLLLSGIPFLVSHHNSQIYEGLTPNAHKDPNKTHKDPNKTHKDPNKTHKDPNKTHKDPNKTLVNATK